MVTRREQDELQLEIDPNFPGESPRFSRLGGPPSIVPGAPVGDPGANRLLGQGGATGRLPPLTEEDIAEGRVRASAIDFRGVDDPTDPWDIGLDYFSDLVDYRRDLPKREDVMGQFGDYPDFDETVGALLGESQAGQAQADYEAQEAAEQGLAYLNLMAEEGFLPEEREKMRLMGQRQDVALRGGEMAAMEESARRGIGGSDISQVAALNAAQAKAQQAALRDVENAAAAEERKRFATMAAGQMGADMAEDSFMRDFRRGEARDVNARKLAELKQDYQANRAQWQQGNEQFNINQLVEQYGMTADAAARFLDLYGFERGLGVAEREGEVKRKMGEPHYPSQISQTISGVAGAVNPVIEAWRGTERALDKETEEAAASSEASAAAPEIYNV